MQLRPLCKPHAFSRNTCITRSLVNNNNAPGKEREGKGEGRKREKERVCILLRTLRINKFNTTEYRMSMSLLTRVSPIANYTLKRKFENSEKRE